MDLRAARATVRSFGRQVRAHRLAAGISQPELGRRARVTRDYIGQIERGTSNPSLITMVLVADALGSNIVDFLPQPNKPEANPVSLRTERARSAPDAATALAMLIGERRRSHR